LLRSHRGLARELGETLLHIQENIQLCRECFLMADSPLCSICSNLRRDKQMICVVEQVFDAEAIEHSGEFHGVYHVLHGRIAPLDDVTPDDLKIKELVTRVKHEMRAQKNIEIILAMNPSSEGEVTAIYIQKLLQPLGVKLTRIATGIPVGGDVQYADTVTLGRALKGRQIYE
jgi:recombination protein RecR